MLKKTLILFTVLTISHISAQSNCTYTINSYSWKFDGADIGNSSNVTIHDSAAQAIVNQGGTLALAGGDVICMDASVPYKNLQFENIIGDPINPVIIKNVEGQVKIKSTLYPYGWKFKNSKYFKILGNGDSEHRYGFRVTTHNNSYIQMIDKTTDFEIAHVEIAGDIVAHQAAVDAAVAAGTALPLELGRDSLGFAGIMAKSKPICLSDPNGGSTDAGQFEMENVSIHDNYIHDVSGEGMYIGYGFSQGAYVKSNITGNRCSTINYPHNVSNLFIYNNIIERVGYDGIQVKNAHRNAQIYNNVIKNYGILENGQHDEGLLVGDGSEAIIYGNWIENGTKGSNGIQINAFGNTKIYNNVVLAPGTNGLYLNNQSPYFANRNGTFEIYNNTIEEGASYTVTITNPNTAVSTTHPVSAAGMVTFTPQDVIIKNNIVFGGANGINSQPNDVVLFNTVEPNTSDVGFVNYATGDVRLDTGSLSIDTGENHITFNKYDFTRNTRLTSTNMNTDIGAFEHGSAINSADLSITITTPSSNNVTAQTTGIDIVGSLIDTKNKVRLVQYILNGTKLIGTDFMPNEIKHKIGYQHLLSGPNTFNIKVTLYGGETFFSAPITINK